MSNIKFVIIEIDDCYTVEINYISKNMLYIEKCSFDMGYPITWQAILGMSINELKKYLIENYNPYKEVMPFEILCWKTKEEVEVVIEYLESILTMKELCS